MDLLSDLRNLFARKHKPAVIDLTAPSSEPEPASDYRPSTDTRPLRVRPVDERSPEHDEILQTLAAVNVRLDQQAEQHDQALERLREIEELLRHAASRIDSIESRSSQTETDRQSREDALATLHETISQHAAVLGLVQQQLDSNSQSTARVVEALSGLRPMLTDMAEGDRRAGELLSDLSQAASEREVRANAAIARWRAMAITVIVLSALAAGGAVTAAIILAVRAI